MSIQWARGAWPILVLCFTDPAGVCYTRLKRITKPGGLAERFKRRGEPRTEPQKRAIPNRGGTDMTQSALRTPALDARARAALATEFAQALESPGLRPLLPRLTGALLPRFARYYDQLLYLLRRVRRALQWQWKRSLAALHCFWPWARRRPWPRPSRSRPRTPTSTATGNAPSLKPSRTPTPMPRPTPTARRGAGGRHHQPAGHHHPHADSGP